MPFGGIRIVEKSCEAYGKKVDENVKFTLEDNFKKESE